MKIAVVGAGIGGLTFALSAHRLGLDVKVYESVTGLRSLGVGINLQPNAVRELTALGLADQLDATAIPTAELAYFSRHGQQIWSEPRGRAAGYSWPQYSIHRGELQMLLLSAVRDRLGEDAVVSGHHLTSFELDGDAVIAQFTRRNAGDATTVIRADVLVGADGIHSTVRATLHSGEGAPKYGKWVMYRGAVETLPFLSGRTMVCAGSLDQRFVSYPMSRKALDEGKALVNWVASLPLPNAGALPPEEWNGLADKEERDRLLRAFGEWRFDWLDVAELIQRTEDVYLFPFVDREPLRRWSHGCITLLGDAAHPMYPIGSQAGSQAIVDARALAAALAAFPDAREALQQYERLRRPAMNELAVTNRGLGAESVLQIVEERAPNGFSKLEDVISRDELEAAALGFKRLAGIDVDAVNATRGYFGTS
jgi:2-polyprenyl-6-methoxyphenol hydroxylase-like FAD-dependent oxidoreductase